MHEDWPTASEVARRLNLDRVEFTQMVRDGKFKAIKITTGGRNGRWRVDPAQFPEFSSDWLSTEAVGKMLGINPHSVAALLRNKSSGLFGSRHGKSWKIDPKSPRLQGLVIEQMSSPSGISSEKELTRDRSKWVPLSFAAQVSGISASFLRSQIGKTVIGEKINAGRNQERWFVDPDSLKDLPPVRPYTKEKIATKNGFPVVSPEHVAAVRPAADTGELTIVQDDLPEELNRVLELVAKGARIKSFSAQIEFEWSATNA